MLDVFSKELAPLDDLIGELAYKPSSTAIWMWRHHGRKGAKPLETVSIGRKLFTTRDELRRFLQESSGLVRAGG